MLIVLSPAKRLDFERPLPELDCTQPRFLADAEKLVSGLKKLGPGQLRQLMGISQPLAELNAARFHSWQPSCEDEAVRPALLAFRGDVYQGLDADSLSGEQLNFAQRHLRILSGLYGLLRPLDLIRPYRLEMGTVYANEAGEDLYDFWGDRIAHALQEDLGQAGADGPDMPVLVNLASQEYFRSVRPDGLRARVVTPVFQEWRGDRWRMISLLAKRARGMMSGWAIRNRIADPERLKEFDDGGYRFNPELSEADRWFFTRSAA